MPEEWLVESMWLVCSLLGASFILIHIAKFIRFIITQFFRPPMDLAKRYGKGTWAIITGASAGIGRGFAVELAKLGFNILIISRSQERLNDAKDEILMTVRNFSPINVATIVADFRLADDTNFWDSLILKINDVINAEEEVSILVNNVGINHTESFATISENFLHDIIKINCTTQMILTRRIMHRLLNRKDPNSKSAIINLSSVAGMRPLLYLSPYCATKAFNDFFSRSLHLEFGDKVDIISLRPGYVVSNMSKLNKTGGFVIDRYDCAKGCLDKLGYVTETYGDRRHAVYARSFFLLPEKIMEWRRKQRLKQKTS